MVSAAVMDNAAPVRDKTTLSLPAYWHPDLLGFIKQPLLRELVEGFAGPLHLVFPTRFADNVRAFQSALSAAGVNGQILFAKKANKARCFAAAAADLGIGIDVASAGELREAVGAGIPGAHIGVSGPAKGDALLRLALHHGSLIAIDAADELERLANLSRTLGKPARILLRLRPNSQPKSRFGVEETALPQLFDYCRNQEEWLRLEGLSFHLSGYDPQARCNEAGRLISHALTARSLGLPVHWLDIGGGFSVSYADASSWRDFITSHGPDDYHAGKRFGGFYPYHSAAPGAAMLTQLLAAIPVGAAASLATLLNRHELGLILEPGRALLDQAGCSVFSVLGVKDRTGERDDYGIVTVDGTSLSLSEQWFDSEFLPDPLLLPRHTTPAAPFRACIGGASCLDSDMLSWRKIAFPQRPAPGDLLVYPNTAGYQMDSNESPFHELPLPTKLVIRTEGAGPRWQVDRPG
ncbi:alanine racemase [Andreprevotia chitinilytica]|uniref:alanine racemase n=1 Tax=Andreprevotia chitinilytica TaxID=396808 RepID=UPI000AFD673D|nr:alanine racemase [Andreprevotia chitinilytica]